MANTVGPGGTSGGGSSGGSSSGESSSGGSSTGGSSSGGSDYDNAEGSGGITEVGIPSKLVGKGGGGGSVLKLPDWISSLKPLTEFVGLLLAFARNPLKFLRSRLFPPIVAGIIGFSFDIAEIIAQPFQVINRALTQGLLSAILNAIGALFTPLEVLINSLIGFVIDATSPLGPLQPFVAVGIILLSGYFGGSVILRGARAILSGIPIIGGSLDTLIFG